MRFVKTLKQQCVCGKMFPEILNKHNSYAFRIHRSR